MDWIKDFLSNLWAKVIRSYLSWTVWFNGIMGTAAVVLPSLQDQLPQLQGYLPANLYHYAMGTLIAGNIILRFKTTKSLADK